MTRYDQPTMPNPALQQRKPSAAPGVQSPIPPPPPQQRRAMGMPQPNALPRRPAPKKRRKRWPLMIAAGIGVMMFTTCFALFAGVLLVMNSGVFPGVSVAGVSLAGMSEAEAAQTLQSSWQQIVLKDGERTWPVQIASLGLTVDAQRTAQAAYEQGRSRGDIIDALFGQVNVTPVVSLNLSFAESALMDMASHFEAAPVNAGVAFVNGSVQATPPQNGRTLDVQATLQGINANPGVALADGVIDLVMREVQPAVIDATPMLAEAQRLLSSPLELEVYDAVTDDSVTWSLPPQVWSAWLTAQPDPNSTSGLSLSIRADDIRSYLQTQAANTFDASRTIDIEQGVQSIQQAVAAGNPRGGWVMVQHKERSYVVQPGETIISIAWDFGIPYLYIQEANGGIANVSAGQTITIPPADIFLEYPVVPNKRIIVSISQQHMWAYENGTLKWDWGVSTGINDSPTWPGVYQILSHEPNAYAGNWNLWMPNFMGVYKPIPGSDFTNGFHGFPTRGGGQILWENSIGYKVTYGCILVSNTHMTDLYNWAEVGTVVIIKA